MYSQYIGKLKNSGIVENIRNLFDSAVNEVKALYDRSGRSIDPTLAEAEVASDLARQFMKKTSDVNRVQRMANGDMRITDKVYNAIKDLTAKVKALGGGKFHDDLTGLEFTYTELREIEKFYEQAAAAAGRRNGSEGSEGARYEVKYTNDHMPATSKFVNDNDNPKIAMGMSDTERYDVLSQKKINVVEYDPNRFEQLIKSGVVTQEDIKKLETQSKKEAKNILRKLAEEFNIYDRYSNDNINVEFEFTRNGLRESINKQRKNYSDFAKMMSVFDDVIKNAVGIEAHGDRYANTSRADKRLKQVYQLVSAFKDGEYIVPVRLTVKEFNSNTDNRLYVAISLNKIEDWISARAANSINDSLQRAPQSSNIISLTDLFANVNPLDGDLIKYIPDNFLNNDQRAAKSKAIETEKQYIARYTDNMVKRNSLKRDNNTKSNNITYSQQFKRWFGDWEKNPNTSSAVVNEDGTPKVVYHGTPRDGFAGFDSFGGLSRYNMFDNSPYFTESRSLADSYTKTGIGSNPELYEAYLNIRNPIDMDAPANVKKWNRSLEQYKYDTRAENGNTNEDVYRALEEEIASKSNRLWKDNDNARYILERMGYDGITRISGERDSGESHRVWIAFRPNQVKSAASNIGTFGLVEPDIRYSLKRDNPIATEREESTFNAKERQTPFDSVEKTALAEEKHTPAQLKVMREYEAAAINNEEMQEDFAYIQTQKNSVDNTKESDIIELNRKAQRREVNTGFFQNLKVPMQKRSVLRVAEKYYISTKGLTFKIQRAEKLLALPIYGSTDYNNIGRIDLFPNSFINEEQMVRTIIHEKCHVKQLQKHGRSYAQNNLDLMEKQAERFENLYYNILKKRVK